MKATLLMFGILVGALSGGGCAYVSADVDVTKRIADDPQLSFAGMGPLAGTVMRDTRTIDASIGDSELLDLVTHAGIQRILFQPRGSVASLDFVRSVYVDIQADSTLPAQRLAEFSADQHSLTADGAIDMRINTSFDHTQYVRDMAPFLLDVTVELAAPATEWGTNLVLELNMGLSRQVNF